MTSEPTQTLAPRFSIIRQWPGFVVWCDGVEARVPGNLSTPKGRTEFVVSVSRIHTQLARGEGLVALRRAVAELAGGQPNAGTVTEEIRSALRAVVESLKPSLTPSEPTRRSGRRRLSVSARLGLSGGSL